MTDGLKSLQAVSSNLSANLKHGSSGCSVCHQQCGGSASRQAEVVEPPQRGQSTDSTVRPPFLLDKSLYLNCRDCVWLCEHLG